MDSRTDLQGWILVGISSCACIAGASIVFIDKLWSKSHNPILESNSFLAGSMSLASGVLLFSSLSILLPASQKKLDSSTLPFVCFFGGALFTAALTKGIHWCTPDAVHACGGPPSPLHNNHFDEERPISPLPSHDSGRGNQEEQENQDSEQRCILNHNKHQYQRHYGAVPFEEAHFRIHPATRSQRLSHLRSTEHNHHHHHHHHRGDDDNNHDHQGNSKDTRDWLRIGIQTAIAIGVHKFPEGLVMFVSSQDSQELGWSVASAMSIHNLTEGFMIALPLYFALQSRSEAFCWAALLGGLSQPLGALMGLLLIENIDQTQEDVVFGVTFGLVSGMMSLITVQSMLPQAIRADKGYRYVLPFFFLGIFLVSLTSILKSV